MIYAFVLLGTSKRVGLGFNIKANCPLVEPGPVVKVFSMGVILRDPGLYLREIWRNLRKTPNEKIDKRDRGLNLELLVYQFRA